MDKSRLIELKKSTTKIVNQASRPGGSLEKGEFTLGLARRLITEEMGLEAGDLDVGEWKTIVKGLVKKALEDTEESTGGPDGSPVKKEPAQKAKKVKPESSSKMNKTQPKDKSPEKSGESEPSSETTKVDDEINSTKITDVGDGNESEMSSVYDVAPAPKRRKKSVESGTSVKEKDSGKGSGKKEKRPKKDVDEGLSPDEAKVAELKRIVVACGVRKQWSKEFADCETASSQIRHLHSLLSGLGMKGTPTIGKAKSLKEKRELAAELDEVREFEAKRGVNDLEAEERASRSKDRKSRSRRSVVEADTDEEEEEDGRVKGNSALDSVLDFLGDQSD